MVAESYPKSQARQGRAVLDRTRDAWSGVAVP